LLEVKDKLTRNVEVDNDPLCNLLEVKIEKSKKDSTYLAPTKKSLKTQIEKLVGRSPSEYDIDEYIGLNKKKLSVDEGYKKIQDNRKEVIKHIQKEVSSYISDHINEIYEVLRQCHNYATDPDYLKELQGEDFLVQVRAYRKLNRDTQKSILLAGEEGKRNVPPGLNTTVDITPGGSSGLWLGELGSYRTIGETNLQTLKLYTNYMSDSHTEVKEKEKEFKSLCQIEAIRNTSALLTNMMFFELAASNFEPLGIVSKSYNLKDIADQMPMAMVGAVSGAVFLEYTFKNKLTKKLPYDYREEGEKPEGVILNSRNERIFFDWLCSKINAQDIQDSLAKLTSSSSGEIPESLDVHGTKWIIKKSPLEEDTITLEDEAGYKIIFAKGKKAIYAKSGSMVNTLNNCFPSLFEIKKKSKEVTIVNKQLGKHIIGKEEENSYTLQTEDTTRVATFSIKIEAKGKKFCITLDKLSLDNSEEKKLSNNYHLIEFNAFPIKVLNGSIYEWYKVKLLDVEDKFLELVLKAAAEAKDPKKDEGDGDGNEMIAREGNFLGTDSLAENIDLTTPYIGEIGFNEHSNFTATYVY
jgi:hypothetical protein